MKSRDLQRLLDNEVFDVAGAAEYLGVKPNSIEIAALRGRIPYVHWSRKKLFCREDLDFYDRNRGQGRKSNLQDILPIEMTPR